MPEPLKNVYSRGFLETLGELISEQTDKFRAQEFVRSVEANDWDELELKARMAKISDCLHIHVEGDFEQVTKVLINVALQYRLKEKTGFEYMFLADYIEQHGQSDFKTSMTALAAITETGSAEFAIRPFIVNQPEKSLKQLSLWSKSKNEHLRRLASEGCRPRLPWAMALPRFKKDPSQILPLLSQLKDDESLYVRRSVANNLNDISKDHPELVLEICTNWHGENVDTNWLVKHALRGLLKAGEPRALELFGFTPPKDLTLRQFEMPTEVQFGNSLEFSFTLSGQKPLGKLRLEYGIDLLKANGSHSKKVFKISEADHAANERDIIKRHKFVPISTRVYYGGTHSLSLIVNGVEMQRQSFELIMT